MDWTTGTKSSSVRGTILVVDDEPAVLEYAAEVLEGYGYSVLKTVDGANALLLLRSNRQIDLLFTDLVMPEIDGIELVRRAREELPDLKVLFTSGYSAHGLPKGPMLRKPYGPRQLAGAIAALLVRP
jgi:CheY-like chemotaxis protein